MTERGSDLGGWFLAGGLAVLGVAGLMLRWVLPEPPHTPGFTVTEVAPVRIELAGGPERASAEVSGLAWFGDELVLLPQYPERENDSVYAISRDAISRALDGGQPSAVNARAVPFSATTDLLDGFDGFEAIAFVGDEVYLTAESRDRPESGWVLRGRVEGALERIVVDTRTAAVLPRQNLLPNIGYETIVVTEDRVLAFYETNGEVNPAPRIIAFDRNLERLAELPMPRLEYRLTDATSVDAEGRFWAVNYHWPGAEWSPGVCDLTARHGEGASHRRCNTVERLVEVTLTDGGVAIADHAPIQLELVDDAHARNWEGIARFGDRGLLLMTDEHPEAMLAFVPF